MRFMVLVKADKKSEAGVLPEKKLLTEMGKYNEELAKAGVLLAAEGLQPSSKGARVRFSGDKRIVIDGPFPETKDLIAGFWIFRVKSKEDAGRGAGGRDKIMHARMLVGDEALMGSDAPPEHYEQTKGFSVSLSIDDPAQAEHVFNALAEKGTVKMPFQRTFWAVGFGMLVDRFGIPWMINCEKDK